MSNLKKKISATETLEHAKFSDKWVVVLCNEGAKIREGLLGKTIAILPFDDRDAAQLICRRVNNQFDLLDVCKEILSKLETMTTKEYQRGGDKSMLISQCRLLLIAAILMIGIGGNPNLNLITDNLNPITERKEDESK